MKQLLDKQFDRLNGPTNYFEGPSGIDRGYRKLATAFGDRDQPGYSSIPNQVRPDAPQDPSAPVTDPAPSQPGQPGGPGNPNPGGNPGNGADPIIQPDPNGPSQTEPGLTEPVQNPPTSNPGGGVPGGGVVNPGDGLGNPYNPGSGWDNRHNPVEGMPGGDSLYKNHSVGLFDIARGQQAAPNSLMGMAQTLMKDKGAK